MEFLSWWFDTHYILSTILSSGWTILWCVFKGEAAVRLIIAVIITLCAGFLHFS